MPFLLLEVMRIRSTDSAVDAALQGMNQSKLQLDAAAHNIANMANPDATAVRVVDGELVPTNDPVELSQEAVALIVAKTSMLAQAKVLHTVFETQKSLLDILA